MSEEGTRRACMDQQLQHCYAPVKTDKKLTCLVVTTILRQSMETTQKGRRM